MVSALRNYGWVVVTLATMTLSYFAYIYFYQWMGYEPNAVTLAGMLLISISLHEFGHWLVMQEYGLRPYLVILVVIGAAAPRDTEAYDRLNRRQLATILLMGPMANFVLVIAGLCMANYTEWVAYGNALASINAALIVFNLLPFGWLDGGQFAKLLFDSVNEVTDRRISLIGTGIAALIATVAVATGYFSLYPALMVMGLLRASSKDNPIAWRESRSMSSNRSWTMFAIWILMWGASLALYIYLPSWEAQYPHS